MAARIHELRTQRARLAKEANEALTAAQAKANAEARDLTDDELAAQDAFDAKLEALEASIRLEERKLDRERLYGSAGGSEKPEEPAVPGSGPQVTDVRQRADADPRRGFTTHRDFFVSCIENSGLRERADVADERLRPLAVFDKEDRVAGGELAFLLPSGFTPKAAAGSDEQGGYSDPYGGFAVPTSRAAGLLQVGFEGDPTAGRTMDMPMATPSVEIMARTDKNHTTSVVGGFTVTRRPETVVATSSRAELEMITLKASGLFGLAYATEELLQDSAISFAALIDAGFRTQFGAHLLNEKIRGGGGNEYLGVLNSPAKVAVAKETNQAADTINFANTSNMISRCWGLDQAVWLANHDTRPQLMQIALPIGTAGVAMYQPSPTEGAPDRLHGRPIFYSEYAAKVGDEGDLILVNWSQFLEGTYQPIQGAESIHVRFVNHERTFKLWTRNAGAPWWRAALTPNKSSDTLSPIVTLAARA